MPKPIKGAADKGNKGPQEQRRRKRSPPGHPYIDDEEEEEGKEGPGHPYVGSEHSGASTDTLAVESAEAKEMRQEEEHAAEPHAPVEEGVAAVSPLEMPDPAEFATGSAEHPATTGPGGHLDLATDSESEISKLDEEDESDASTKATTATPKKPPMNDSDASTKATTATSNSGRNKKKPSVRGGFGGYSDADEYDVYEEYDAEYESYDWNPRHPEHAYQHIRSQGFFPTVDAFFTGSASTPPPRRAANHSHSHFDPRGRPPVNLDDLPFPQYGDSYVPPRRPRPRRVPSGGWGDIPGPSEQRGHPRKKPARRTPQPDPAASSSSQSHPSFGQGPSTFGVPPLRSGRPRGPTYKPGRAWREPPRRKAKHRVDDDSGTDSEFDFDDDSDYDSEDDDDDSDYDSKEDDDDSFYEAEESYNRRYSGRSSHYQPPNPEALKPKPEDYYAVLGVSRDSTQEE